MCLCLCVYVHRTVVLDKVSDFILFINQLMVTSGVGTPLPAYWPLILFLLLSSPSIVGHWLLCTMLCNVITGILFLSSPSIVGHLLLCMMLCNVITAMLFLSSPSIVGHLLLCTMLYDVITGMLLAFHLAIS